MDRTTTVTVSMPTDENGLVGRQCPACHEYFKLKPGTGLPISTTRCPYCGRQEDQNEFLTPEQRRYIESVAVRQVLGPVLSKFQRDLKRLEFSGPFVSLKVTTSPISLPVRYYRERDVETGVVCDHCGLVFAVFGVFAGCPDCGRLNAWTVFGASLDVAEKRLNLADRVAAEDAEMGTALVQDALRGAVGTFDALGKALRAARPDLFPERPPNLFQNVDQLSAVLERAGHPSLAANLGAEDFGFLRRLVQVRHLHEHDLGVVDARFVAKMPEAAHLKGRKYPLQADDVRRFFGVLRLAAGIRACVESPDPRRPNPAN